MDASQFTQLIGAIAFLFGAIGVLWRYVLRPALRAFTTIDDLGPVVKEMAQRYKKDDGFVDPELRTQVKELRVQLGEVLQAIKKP